MATSLYIQMTQALSAHWRNHANKYPQKLLLSPAQHQELNDYRYGITSGQPGTGKGAKAVAGEKFMGVVIEHDPGSPGVLIDVNGEAIPLQVPPVAQ